MSAFDTNTPLDTTPAESDIDPYATLVGDDKKFKTPQDLAKGKLEADRFITDLQRQIAEMRGDIEESSKIDELLQLVKTQKAETPEDKAPDHTDPVLDADKLKALIESHVSDRETQTSREKNISESDAMLTSKYGDSAARVLQSRASELNMSVDELKEVAGRNPKAFAKLIGDEAGKPNSTLLGNSQRSEGGTNSEGSKRTFAFYQDLRRKNKTEYHSSKVQAQMFKDRVDMGEAFYGN